MKAGTTMSAAVRFPSWPSMYVVHPAEVGVTAISLPKTLKRSSAIAVRFRGPLSAILAGVSDFRNWPRSDLHSMDASRPNSDIQHPGERKVSKTNDYHAESAPQQAAGAVVTKLPQPDIGTAGPAF